MADPQSLSDSTALRDEAVLRRVRHLGSARDGLKEWQLQRLTAVAWLASPVAALLVIFFIIASFAHALVGLRSVLADYVHTRVWSLAAELLVSAATIILASASVLAVLKLMLARQ